MSTDIRDKVITVEQAAAALNGWEGDVCVTVQRIGDAAIDGNTYGSVEEAVSDFNESVRECARDPYYNHDVSLCLTWSTDPEDEYASWETEPVITVTV